MTLKSRYYAEKSQKFQGPPGSGDYSCSGCSKGEAGAPGLPGVKGEKGEMGFRGLKGMNLLLFKQFLNESTEGIIFL